MNNFEFEFEFEKSVENYINMLMGIEADKKEKRKRQKELKRKIEAYNHILDNFVDLCRTLEITNVVDIYFFYMELLKSGYLSFGKSFKIDGKEKFINLGENQGLHVINGIAVCRHIVDFLQRVYKRMGIDSYYCSCNVGLVNKNNHFRIPSNVKINHSIILTKHNDSYLFLDPTNSLIMYPFKNRIIKTTGQFFMTITDDIFQNFDNNSRDDVKLLVDKVFSSGRKYIYKYEMMRMEALIKNKIITNKDIIEDFYTKCENDINLIANGIRTEKPNKRFSLIRLP